MKTVFVTGGTGFVGSHLVDLLIKKGVRVKTLVRDKSPHNEAEAVKGDILRPETFVNALTDVDAVINLVGIIREFPKKSITFEKLHFWAAKNVTDAACAADVKKIIHMSANGARPQAESAYHTTKYKAEEYIKQSGIPYTIFRPSVIYGKGDAFITMLARYMRMTPFFTYFGDGSYPLQPVSVQEVSEAFANSLFEDRAADKVYPLCGNQIYTYKELLHTIAKVMGKKIFLFPVSESAVNAAIDLFGGYSFFPLTRDQFIMLKEGNTCDDCSAFSDLKIHPRVFEEEIKTYIK